MSEEKIKEIAREEMLDTIKTELNSSMIFVYVKNLEQENKQLKERLKNEERVAQEYLKIENRIDKAIEYIKNNSLYYENYDYNEEDNLELKYIDDEIARNDLLEILGEKENE